jgi:hypothetical protein
MARRGPVVLQAADEDQPPQPSFVTEYTFYNEESTTTYTGEVKYLRDERVWKHGYGTQTWLNENTHTGGYKNNKMEGPGTFTYTRKNEVHQSKYVNGSAAGDGVKWYSDGTASLLDGSQVRGRIAPAVALKIVQDLGLSVPDRFSHLFAPGGPRQLQQTQRAA